MHPFLEYGPLAAGVAASASSAWYVKTRLRSAQQRIARLSARERELRFAAHALMAASRTSPEAVVEAIDRAARIVAPMIDATIFAEVDDDALAIRYADGMHALYLTGARIDPAGDSPLAVALRRGHRITNADAPGGALPGQRGFIAVPLVDIGRVIGVICFSSREEPRIADEGALVTIVDLAVTAYQLARERRADIAEATIDSLTGLLTPRAFRRRLFDELADARMMRLPASLLFIDTDNFKSCNDTLGHAAGDVVLGIVADVLREHGGCDAIAARNGGDEFCLLLRAGKATAVKRAEAIRRAIEGYDFASRLGVVPQRPITLSIGVASMPDDAAEPARLLESADAAMYRSKHAGRNRTAYADGRGGFGVVEAETATAPY